MSARSRLFTRAAASVAAASLGLVAIGVVASPAAAAGPALPTGSALYALSCDSDAFDNLTVFSIDVTTAAATQLGDGSPDVDDCSYQAAWDASTGTAYVDVDAGTLATVELTTGYATPVADFTIDEVEYDVDSIAITPAGDAYAIIDGVLFTLDLTTGALTGIGPIANTGTLYSFAADPTTGELIAVSVGGEVFSVDPITGTGTLLAQLDIPVGDVTNYFVYSLQIDTAGVYWLEVDVRAFTGEGESTDDSSQLWSTTRAALGDPAVLSGTLTVDGETPLLESLLFVPAPVVPVIPAVPVVPVEPAAVVPPVVPTLANTGVDAAPLAAGGALVALLGVALLVPAIRRRATA
jgi:hypothetical protein